MTSKHHINGIVLVLALWLSAPGYAQTGGSQNQPGHVMPGMDMQAMMTQCAQMRQQMRPNSKLTPYMQRMMTQCDEMDAQMNSASGTPSGTRPKTR